MSYSFLDKKYFKTLTPEIYNDKLYKDIGKDPPIINHRIRDPEPVKARINANNHYETLENTPEVDPKSDYAQMLLHLDYVMNNEMCKEIIIKKLGLDKNLLNEDLIELISFILFGVMIVFILDRMRH